MRYLQLTHNEWDPVTKTSRPKVLHSFGREDQLDRNAIRRLVVSLTRLLDPASALTGTTTAGSEGLAFTSSRPVGGTLALDALWRRLGIDTVMARLLAGRKRDPRTERVLFALVANRALAPGSKLAAADWVTRRAHIDGLAETSDDACYRAMDWLSNSGRHRQRPDQHERHRLDTRLSRRSSAFPQVNVQIPCPGRTSAAEPGSHLGVDFAPGQRLRV